MSETAEQIAMRSGHEVIGNRICVECIECAFVYSAEHATDENPPRYDCPVCDLTKTAVELTRARDELSRLRASLPSVSDHAD